MIVKLPLGVSNAYLLQDKCSILVDTGSKGNFKKLLWLLNKNNCPVSSLDYIFITHGHWDHCANVAALKKLNPAIKIIMQQADVIHVQSGNNATIKPFGWFGKLLAPFFNLPFDAFTPDIVFNDILSLKNLGIGGYVLHTPGHTKGSASLILENNKAIVGDLIMGAPVLSHKASYHFFIEDYELNNHSLRDVISRNVNDFYVGHGNTLNIKNVFWELGKKCFYH
jgi:glyoxylase-like metal-dependent hydrolase (beta-lactamase superfamily II)